VIVEPFSFLGRFHPVVLHLPIGFLLLAFVLELRLRFGGKKEFQSAIAFSLQLALAASLLSVISGYLLSWGGGYDATMLWRHQYLGFGVLALNALLVFYAPKPPQQEKRIYFPLFCVLVVLLGLTGHLGGSLTHGSDFLSFSSSAKTNKTILPLTSESNFYEVVVQKILDQNCVTCHRASKQKGGLRLDDQTQIIKGGDSGKILGSTKALSHSILTRIHLPLEEEEHMPPEGKKQLNKSELNLLQYWLEEGASFEKNIGLYQMGPAIKKQLSVWESTQVGADGKNQLKPVKAAVLQELQKKGIEVRPIAYESPYLEAKYVYQDSLDFNPLNALKKIKGHLQILKLHHTPINDQQIKNIGAFVGLKKLDLHQTAISNQGLKKLVPLKNLEYLNLYGTSIDDQGLEALKTLSELKELYLWQTEVSTKGVEDLKKAIPQLTCNLGRTEMVFGKSQIKVPIIRSSSKLLKDTLQVKIESRIPNGILHYTLDGSIPDSNATVYTKSLVLDKSCTLKTICKKSGWEDSEVIEREFIKPDHLIQSARLLQTADEKYSGRGDTSLYDLQSAKLATGHPAWLGFQGQDVEMILDLGSVEEVEKVMVSSFSNVLAWVFPIRQITCRTSVDGESFSKSEKVKIPEAVAGAPVSSDFFPLSFSSRKARYLKIKLKSQMRNPSWHASPGEPSWVFIDEVLVW